MNHLLDAGGRSWKGRQLDGKHLGSGVAQDKGTSSTVIEETLSLQTLCWFWLCSCGFLVICFGTVQHPALLHSEPVRNITNSRCCHDEDGAEKAAPAGYQSLQHNNQTDEEQGARSSEPIPGGQRLASPHQGRDH